MGLFSAFDAGFDGADVTASITRKGEDGITRGGRLTGAVPTGMSVDEFAEAARFGLARTMKGKDRGATLSKKAPELTGDRAAAAVLSFADPAPAAKPDPVPEATRRRGRSVLANAAPSVNNGAPAGGAAQS